jgi:S1-C subfamily serine protease
VFFLSADEKVYARYGGRDARGPDERQSLEGLRYTMQSVLDMHRRPDPAFAPRVEGPPKYLTQLAGGFRARGCYHCHQVKEIMNNSLMRTGKWSRDLVYRYPLPDNVGMLLEVDRGNVVRAVTPDSPAARAGLRPGDVVRRLAGVPVHSQADAQFALDRAPQTGEIALRWQRGDETRDGTLALVEGWRKGDLGWRPSLHRLVPSLPLYGKDLTAAEKQSLDLPAKRLVFRHKADVHPRMKAAGVRAGDVILGVDGKALEGMDVDLQEHVRRQYLVGDRITLNVLREGQRVDLPLTLR